MSFLNKRMAHVSSLSLRSRWMPVLGFVALAILVAPSLSEANENGASDERVKLPEGPGSLEGIGENAQVNGVMGLMSWSVPISVPKGHPGATPSMAIGYSSGAGQSVVGMGWSLAMPHIERMTRFGLPEYDVEDQFAVNGGTQLVRVDSEDPPQYRARFEGGFVRYFWMAQGDGSKGWWKIEHPNGSVAAYGADLSGKLVPNSRFEGKSGTFRYHLVESRDVYGNTMRYDYSLSGDNGDVPLLDRIGYGYDDVNPPATAQPRFEIAFLYEARQDYVSDAKSGREELLTERLAKVFVRTNSKPIRRYELSYEDYSASGGFTRLAAVNQYGRDGGLNIPSRFTFSYSQVLGSKCTVGECTQPFLQSMGTIPGGVSLSSGQATLIDINGDSLPDVLHTPLNGPHQFFLNKRSADGNYSFGAGTDSQLGQATEGKTLGTQAQPLDVDGDGFCDLLLRKNGTYLRNTGSGDWTAELPIGDIDSSLPSFGDDFDLQENNFDTIRFFDYDNDKRIDILQTPDANTTLIFRNNGDFGFSKVVLDDPVGASFEQNHLDLADMNGDGLMDLVEKAPNNFRYRLNLGFGHFEPWQQVADAPFSSAANINASTLQDINGDGLDDLVLVKGSTVQYALNNANGGFLAVGTLTQALSEGSTEPQSLPNYNPDTGSVLYADVNGNGSTDIVWVGNNGEVTFLELFPLRPNLLTRIENGIGKVSDVQYGTSVQHRTHDQANATTQWPHATPTATQVVDRVDEWNRTTELHDITDYRYHSGYFDPGEKMFQGFERVEQRNEDEHTEPSISVSEYDLGAATDTLAADPYRNGELLRSTVFGTWIAGPRGALGPAETGAPEVWREIRLFESESGDCGVAGVPTDLDPPVRHRCVKSSTTTEKEGLGPEHWVVLRSRFEYDGYGNVTKKIDDGIVSIGGKDCALCDGKHVPCGPECTGDELIIEDSFIEPLTHTDGRWILGKVYKHTMRAALDGELISELHLYFDGLPFEGLEAGKLTIGNQTRKRVRVSNKDDDFLVTTRVRYNKWGKLAERLHDEVTVDNPKYRTITSYDERGLRVVRAETFLEDADGPYSLRAEYDYDGDFDLLTMSSRQMLFRDGVTNSLRDSAQFEYDEFARLQRKAEVDSTLDQPTETYEYEWGNEDNGWYTKQTSRTRSKAGGLLDQEAFRCIDGRGGELEQRLRINENRIEVSSRAYRNGGGSPIRIYGVHKDDSLSCSDVSDDVPYSERFYDAMGRAVRIVLMDRDRADGPTEIRTEFRPRQQTVWDQDDLDSTSADFDTPTAVHIDGRGHFNKVVRFVSQDKTRTDWFRFDESGELLKHIDPKGGVREQVYDMAGRAISVTDSSRGTTTFEYDRVGNVVRQVDGNGNAWRSSYDGANRLTASWDETDEEATRVEYQHDAVSDCPTDQCTHAEGLLASMSYPAGDDGRIKEWYGYNRRGLVAWHGRQVRGTLLETSTEYDETGNPILCHYPGGISLSMERDAAGRITSVPGFVDELNYDDRGMPQSMTLHNGVKTQWTYDIRQQPQSLTTTGPDGHAIVSLVAKRDRGSRIIELIDSSIHAETSASASATYRYDVAGRLAEATLNPSSDTFRETISYSYDDAGATTAISSSLVSSPRQMGAFEYETSRPYAVTKAGDLKFEYDPAGQMTQRANDHLVWDSMGRLVGVNRNDVEIERTVYGAGTDRLMRRTLDHEDWFFSGMEVRDGVASVLLRLGNQSIARIETTALMGGFLVDVAPAELSGDALMVLADGVITAADAWIALMHPAAVAELDGPRRQADPRVLLSASARALVVGNEQLVTYLHDDLRSNTVAVTDETGTEIEHHIYYPFGSILGAAKLGTNEARFVGKEHSSETGLTYFGSRFLDSQTGRWISPDRGYLVLNSSQLQQLTDATDLYGYAENDPINNTDTTGRIIEPASAAIWGFNGVVINLWAARTAENILHRARQKTINEINSNRANRSGYEGRSTAKQEIDDSFLLKDLKNQPHHSTKDAIKNTVLGATTGALTYGLGIPGMVVFKLVDARIRARYRNPDGLKARLHGFAAGGIASLLVGGAVSAALSGVWIAFDLGLTIGSEASPIIAGFVDKIPGGSVLSSSITAIINLPLAAGKLRAYLKKRKVRAAEKATATKTRERRRQRRKQQRRVFRF